VTRRIRLQSLTALAALAVTIAPAGCAPVLTKRYAVVTGSVGDGTVSLSASAFPIDPPGPKTIFDLAGEGQAAAVAAFAAKSENLPGLQAAIAAPIARASNSGIQDVSTISRRVVLSVGASHRGLADRLDASTVTLHLKADGPAKFKSWNQLATKFETIDLGKMNFTQKGTLSAGLEGSAPGSTEIDKATLGATLENTLAEEVLLRQRYVVSSGVLTETEARVIQQGAVGLDLVGNITIDLTIAARQTAVETFYRADNLFDAKGGPQQPGEIRLIRKFVRYPTTVTGGWSAEVQGRYRRRKVTVGAETITESDDEVTYEAPMPSTSGLVLASEDDLKISKWVLMAGRQVMAIQEADGTGTLQFDSYDGARDFLLWLKASTATSANGRTLGFASLSGTSAPAALTTEQRSILRVEIMGVNWVLPTPPAAPR
jgi:hypothetical protein